MTSKSRSYLILLMSGLFLFYKYVIQNFPSVMVHDLMNHFHLQGFGIGILSGAYFWTYLITPFFAGMLMDKWGVRGIVSLGIFCCAVGLWIFSKATDISLAIFGRALLGIGVSFATISYLKLTAMWFPTKYYSLLTSLMVFIGMMGAILGQMPLTYLIHQVGWQQSLLNLAETGLLLSICFYLGVGNQNPQQQKSPSVQNMLSVLSKKQNILLSAYSGLSFAPLVIFCSLWGHPFLQKYYHFSPMHASYAISYIFIGLALASPFFAFIVPKVKSRILLMIISTCLSAVALSLVLSGQKWMLPWVLVCLCLFGFALGPFAQVFVIAKESNTLMLTGTVISMVNAGDAFLDAIFEPLLGWFMDCTTISDNTILLILPLLQILGAIILIGIQEPKKN